VNFSDALLRLERAGLRRDAAIAAIATGSGLTGVGLLTLQPAVFCYGLAVIATLAVIAKGPGDPQHPVSA
jgi:hypothetical protein